MAGGSSKSSGTPRPAKAADPASGPQPERLTIPDEIHPRAAALRAGVPVAALPPVHVGSPAETRAITSALEGALPYADDADYLEHQLTRLRAVLDAAIALGAGDAAAHDEARAREQAIERAITGRVSASPRTPGLETLRVRFGLSPFEVDALLHALAPSLDASILKLQGRLSGTAWRTWVDVGFVIHVHFDGVAARLRAREHFLPTSTLLRQRLLLLDRGRPDARENLLACELKLPPRVTRLITGIDPSAGTLPSSNLIEPDVTLDDVVLPPEIRSELDGLIAAQPGLSRRLGEWGFDRVMHEGRGVIVLLTGPPGTGKSTLARALAHRLGKRLLVVDAQKLLESKALEDQIEDVFLDARIQDAVVLFDECEFLFGARGSGNRALGTLLRALDRFDGLAVLATNLPDRLDPAVDRRMLLRVNLEVPPPALREQIWRIHLPPEVPLAEGVELNQLAKRYDFSGGYIKNAVLLAVSRALARGDSPPRLTMADLDGASQTQLRGDLSSYAERTRSSLGLDVLILPEDIKSQIVEIIAAGRNRSQVLYAWGFNETIPTGKGLVVLLSGDPGTGKTLSAEVIAAELGMTLHRINPAKVVSKFVGETEKNLNEILAQAKSMHSILFFDEADALFSSRVAKIESANDRFVNMETNFLLQQLERYEGIVILATNLETSIDQAFKRRIHYHIVIPFPDPPARERIWRGIMPARAPVAGDVDYPKLGKTFDLSGGHIKNAVMRAAYLAAQSNVAISQALLAEAAERECAAAGKLFQHKA
ncbi:MAG: AAA family ATPase [Myxococcales bacterium]|nr:AAA family ATPase [Myxococcales bacterium]